MIIKSINLNNIRSYLTESIEFPLGSTLLSGDIGSGKSTILQAIEFALFGTRGAASQLLRHGQDSGFVELNFSLDNDDITVKRILKRGKSVSQESCHLSVNGIRKECMPTELKAQIMGMFGYPKDASAKDSPIFRYTVYTPQEEMKHIMLSSDDRLTILRKIFNIDKYGRIRSNAKILLSDLRTTKRLMEEYTKDLNRWVQDCEDKTKTLGLAKDELGKIGSTLAAVISNIQLINADLEGKKKEIETLYRIKTDASRKEAELKSYQTRELQIEKEVSRSEERIKQLKIDLQDYISVQKPEETGNLQKSLDQLEYERLSLTSHIAVLGSEILKIKKTESGVCITCGQTIQNADDHKAELEEMMARERSLRMKMNSLESEVNAAKSRLQEFQSSALKWEKKSYLEKSLTDIETARKELALEGERLESEIADVTNEIAVLSAKLQSSAGIDAEYRALESKLSNEQIIRLRLEKEKSRFEQQLEDLQNAIKSLMVEIEKKKTAKAKIHIIDELTNWMENQFVILMDAMEKSVMTRINQEFMSLFQKWFDVLMQDDVLSVRLDEEFSPIIQQNGYETAYENLSGGEKTAVALAYRLALNKVINELVENIKTKDLLILDEPTDGFSSEQLDRIRDVINELKLKQIIIVSHEAKIDTFVDNVICLAKDQHVSRIVR